MSTRSIPSNPANAARARAGRSFFLIPSGIFAIALATSFLSSLNPFSTRLHSADSAVFLTIAQGISNGKVPYVDFFDHKGPLLYFIDWLGLSLGGTLGVWIIELLLLALGATFAYKTARFFSGRLSALVATCLVFIVLTGFIDSGNMPEENSIPFLFASFYLFTRRFLSAKTTPERESDTGIYSRLVSQYAIFLTGFCFGCILLIKPNLSGLIVAFYATFFAWNLLEKQWTFLIRSFIQSISGLFIALLPFAIYLAVNDALGDFVYQYFIFNRKYVANTGGLPTIANNFLAVLSGKGFVWALILFCFYKISTDFIQLKKRPDRDNFTDANCVAGANIRGGWDKPLSLFISPVASLRFDIAWGLSIAATILLFLGTPCLGPRNLIVLVPLYIPALAFLTMKLFACFERLPWRSGRIIFPFFILVAVFYQQIRFAATEVYDISHAGVRKKHGFLKRKLTNVRDFVFTHRMQGDTISVIGNNCNFYFYIGLPSASKYIYQHPVVEMTPEIAEEYQADIETRFPRFIFLAWPHVSLNENATGDLGVVRKTLPRIASLLEEKYEVVLEEKGLVVVYQRKDSGLPLESPKDKPE